MPVRPDSLPDQRARPRHTGTRKRVLIVDDHQVVRDGMRRRIAATADLCVCGEAANDSQARQAIAALHPHVAVIDLSLGEESGVDLVRWVRHHHPAVSVIVASMHDEALYGAHALRAGAQGYVAKSRPARTILTAIREVLKGELYFSKELVESVMRNAANGEALQTPVIELLSERELEVFRRLGQGLACKEIAHALHLSVSTVDTYRKRLKVKLGAKRSAELAYRAARWVLENP
jgi:DNA-binding NarL/FixJ family response regulator